MNDELKLWLDKHLVDSVLMKDINVAHEIFDLIDDGKTLELMYSDAGTWTYNICTCSVSGARKQLRVIFNGLYRVILYAWALESGGIIRGWYIA